LEGFLLVNQLPHADQSKELYPKLGIKLGVRVDRERYEDISRKGEVCKSFWADLESSRTVSHVSIQDRASAINFDHSLTRDWTR